MNHAECVGCVMWLRLILFVASLYAPPSAVRGEGTTMSDKLDPILASLCETATSDERGHAIMIVVAVRRPADGDMLRALAARGCRSSAINSAFHKSCSYLVNNFSASATSLDGLRFSACASLKIVVIVGWF